MLAPIALALALGQQPLAAPLPPPPEEERVALDARVPEGLVPSLRLGLWLTQSASNLRNTHFSPGLRVGKWLGERIFLDLGYQFAYSLEGTSRVSVVNTFHALDLRVHYRLPVGIGPVAFTAGIGTAGYVVISTFSDGANDDGTSAGLRAGVTAALGMETRVGNWPMRFETALASRGSKLDALFCISIGYTSMARAPEMIDQPPGVPPSGGRPIVDPSEVSNPPGVEGPL
jgi:hypothetical protein